MTSVQSMVAFAFAAGLLTIATGLDTALAFGLRRSRARGAPQGGHLDRARMSPLGLLVACGGGALLASSRATFTALQWCGGAHLV